MLVCGFVRGRFYHLLLLTRLHPTHDTLWLIWRQVQFSELFCAELRTTKLISRFTIRTLVKSKAMRSLIQQRLGEGSGSANTDCWADWQSFNVCGCSTFSSLELQIFRTKLLPKTLKWAKSGSSSNAVHYLHFIYLFIICIFAIFAQTFHVS